MQKYSLFNGKRVSEILSIPLKIRSDFENLELLELTYQINFFSQLREKYSDALHRKCSKYLVLERFSKNQHIYQKGDPGLKYYILLEGEVSLVKSSEKPQSDFESSSSSSEELDEDYGLNNQKTRCRAFNINSDILFELAKSNEHDASKEIDFPVISKDILERESKELIEFIMKVEGSDQGREVRIVKPGGDFGQDAFFPSRTRGLSAVARSQVEVASLHKIIFKKIVHEIANDRGLQMIGFLQKIQFFSKWGKSDLAKILHYFKLKFWSKGQYLYKEGEVPNHVYFVISGNFVIRKNCNRPLTQQSQFGNNNLRHFSSSTKKTLIKLDLAIKGEREILGADEISNKNPFHFFSCICNSASAETYEMKQSDFLRLFQPEMTEDWFNILKTNNEWLKTRSETLEENHEIFNNFESQKLIQETKKTAKIKYNEKASQKNLKIQAHQGRRFSSDVQPEKFTVRKSFVKRIYWNSFDLANIHVPTIKKKNPRLAPKSFLLKFREKVQKDR